MFFRIPVNICIFFVQVKIIFTSSNRIFSRSSSRDVNSSLYHLDFGGKVAFPRARILKFWHPSRIPEVALDFQRQMELQKAVKLHKYFAPRATAFQLRNNFGIPKCLYQEGQRGCLLSWFGRMYVSWLVWRNKYVFWRYNNSCCW
jgi:hypothetical protein